MNRTQIEWVKNPDGSQGYTWNPITGCLNGCPYCYARKLANGRLKKRYLANEHTAPGYYDYPFKRDPFYPREWLNRRERLLESTKPKGVFVCDMSDLFGISIPESWTNGVLETIKVCPEHRFYLLTKQPQNLARFSPFPDNAWVGITATDEHSYVQRAMPLIGVEASVKYISFEPLLGPVDRLLLRNTLPAVDWVIIGAQTKPKRMPSWDWVKDIIDVATALGIPVFLKNNLGLPKWNCEGGMPFYKKDSTGTMELRQELPV